MSLFIDWFILPDERKQGRAGDRECARENEKPRRLSFPFFQLFLELFLAEEAEEEEDDGDGDEDESGIYIYCGLNMSLN